MPTGVLTSFLRCRIRKEGIAVHICTKSLMGTLLQSGSVDIFGRIIRLFLGQSSIGLHEVLHFLLLLVVGHHGLGGRGHQESDVSTVAPAPATKASQEASEMRMGCVTHVSCRCLHAEQYPLGAAGLCSKIGYHSQ